MVDRDSMSSTSAGAICWIRVDMRIAACTLGSEELRDEESDTDQHEGADGHGRLYSVQPLPGIFHFSRRCDGSVPRYHHAAVRGGGGTTPGRRTIRSRTGR